MKKALIKVIIGIIAIAAIVYAGYVIIYDIVGYELGEYAAVCKVTVEGNRIEADVSSADSISCVRKVTFEEERCR